jgi:serine/threonine protein phosphatase PrpC
VISKIGDFCFKNNDNLKLYEQPVISYPEVKKYHITSDTEFIVLGSDGFWDCVDVQQICQYISIQLKEKSSPISKIISGIFDRILSKTERSILLFT